MSEIDEDGDGVVDNAELTPTTKTATRSTTRSNVRDDGVSLLKRPPTTRTATNAVFRRSRRDGTVDTLGITYDLNGYLIRYESDNNGDAQSTTLKPHQQSKA